MIPVCIFSLCMCVSQSHMKYQMALEYDVWFKLVLESQFSRPSLLGVGISGVYHHVAAYSVVVPKLGLEATVSELLRGPA